MTDGVPDPGSVLEVELPDQGTERLPLSIGDSVALAALELRLSVLDTEEDA